MFSFKTQRNYPYTRTYSHETAYVSGLNIGDSVGLVEDLLEYAEKEDLTGILFSSDFEKKPLILLTTVLCSHVLKGLDLAPDSFSGSRCCLSPKNLRCFLKVSA